MEPEDNSKKKWVQVDDDKKVIIDKDGGPRGYWLIYDDILGEWQVLFKNTSIMPYYISDDIDETFYLTGYKLNDYMGLLPFLSLNHAMLRFLSTSRRRT